MADTNLLVLAREYKKLREEVKKVLSMPKGDKGDPGEKGEKGDKGDTGPQGFPGRDGKDGVNGFNGKDGRDGIDGKDGKDGLDGVGVANAYIDFDNSLVIVLSDGREVNAGFLSQETKENVVATFKQGAATINELLPPQEGNANKFLKTDGTNVSWDTLDGSDIDLASPPVIGNTTPNAATFTTLTANSTFQFGKSSANYGQGTGGATTKAVEFRALGSDTNVALAVRSQGTGGIDLAAGSSGVNISNGTTVTAITRTAAGSGYTSVPSVVISAPTTAGGVQATATVSVGVSTFAVASGGSGYTVGDSLTVVGGTGVATVVTVSTVSAGAVTGVTYASGGSYTVTPTNPVSVTGGTGTGATLNITYTINNSFTITNAGSGYVEQPTVTFSGGGGSGAAAYATVGSGATVRSLGSAMSFVTPGGEQFRVADFAGTTTDYIQVIGSNFGRPVVRSNGTGNLSLGLSSTGTGSVQIFTNATAQEQLRVAHTASAVNYVQVTGAATGGATVISAQGSDSNVNINLQAKGSGQVRSIGWMSVGIGAPNYWQLASAASGAAPALSVQGSDTNIGLNLTTKGTGNLDLNTGNGIGFRVFDGGATSINYWSVGGGANAVLRSVGNGAAFFDNNNAQPLIFRTQTSVEQFRIANTASAVNYVQVTGAATGNATGPSVTAAGSDANIPITFTSKGTGAHRFVTGAGLAVTFVDSGGTTANFLQIQGRQAGNGPIISAQGSDANVDINLTPKGTGLVRFGTYTAGALSIAGYIEIKDAGGTVRRLAVVA